jgi:hypothetical protein
MIYGTRITIICIAVLLSLSVMASAGDLTIPNTFTNDTKADAEEVNANFTAVETAVKDNNARINALSNPRSASVTYSAMGFVPENNTIQFSKNLINGSLSIPGGTNGGSFFHCLTIRPGVTITRIRAHPDEVTASLYQQGSSESLATSNSTVDISITTDLSTSYFIEIPLNNPLLVFYSVSIDYTYTEPAPEP